MITGEEDHYIGVRPTYLEATDVVRCEAETGSGQAEGTSQAFSHCLECRLTVSSPVLGRVLQLVLRGRG